MIDPNLGLRARNDLLYIADHWTDLRARLRPGGGSALTGMPSGTSDGHCPIDVHVSDLLWEVESEARMLAHVLMDETDDWTPRTSRMPGLLADVAERYGHWTAGGDERAALDFMDWAEEYAGKVRRALERPAPPSYVGPCQGRGEDGAGCAGELYLREGRDAGRCRECGAEFTRFEQEAFVEDALRERLMTVGEITSALAVLHMETPYRTVQSWARRKKIEPVDKEAGLYRLADAIPLAMARVRAAA